MNPAILASIPVIGDVIGGLFGNSAQKKANKANIQLQRENQAWMERLSNTEWQRGTADMRAAGLNPMLAFSQGGASSPSGSAARVEPEDAIGRGISSAGSKAAQALTLANLQEQTRLTREKANQEALITEDMRKDRSTVTVTDDEGNTVGGMSPVERRRRLETAQAQLAETNLSIRKIEEAIAEQTQGANVGSAKAREQLLNQEINMNQFRTLLLSLDVPEKQAMAKWFETVGAASPGAKAVMTISQWLKFMFGGR